MRSETYQNLLILSGIIVSAFFAIFFYREVYPEYKIYQEDYIALEKFRSTYTGQPAPPFKTGVKQIVIEREDKGPAIVDRCTSCHVALQIPYFSPTKISYDLNGNIIRDPNGHPVLVPNDEYMWHKLNEKIRALRDEKVLQQLESENQTFEIKQRLKLADQYEALKIAKVGDHTYDVTKVLSMHPLIGSETRPFEFHPIEEYGCTSCHSGNGRGLVTDKAHGPVFDGEYEIEVHPTKQFTQPDPENDPPFARMFNYKPGHELLFQTEPILIGPLIQAKCMHCHQTSDVKLTSAAESATNFSVQQQQKMQKIVEAFENEKKSIYDLLKLKKLVDEKGYVAALSELDNKQLDYSLPPKELDHLASQIQYLKQSAKGQPEGDLAKFNIETEINHDLSHFLGSARLLDLLEEEYMTKEDASLDAFIKRHQKDPDAKGTLFAKEEMIDVNQNLLRHAEEATHSFATATKDLKVMSALTADVDELTSNFTRGNELYISQACYACHRIAGFARGGVGPELTRIGNSYPWYVKESIVWPQADLPTSTMPNMRLDHVELEDLMAFLLAQKGGSRAVAQTAYQQDLLSWEGGRKLSWEKPIPPSQMYDLRYAMTLFATEGCAACHRLQGFDSNIGFGIEKNSPSLDQLYEEQHWFRKLFPEVVHYTYYDEELPGSEIVHIIESHAQEIDEKIVSDVRKNGILEEIDTTFPEVIESFYSPFRYASRAKNFYYRNLLKNEREEKKKEEIQKEWSGWKDRVHRVLMMYIQTYGLGRLIGPHLNWSGVYRTDEWLMEHFRNPTNHVPRSIMPSFPFDDTKFYALTHMLDVLALHNRNLLRQQWNLRGFDPAEAYEMLCAQCHGVGMIGNGAIAEWIYPIPKNLHNPEFLRNLTKEKANFSIMHGVKGTPMPPWGEFAPNKAPDIQKIATQGSVLRPAEIRYLVNWLFSALPGGEVIRQATDVPKWQYTPEDVVEELKKEGGRLIPEEKEKGPEKQSSSLFWIPSSAYYASLSPIVYPQKKKEDEVENIFDIIPNYTNEGSNNYYIKKKYYTTDNIAEGQNFFLINCAVCHGNEADGSGTRSQAMREAKPRMLTNLDWINSRDDLRLLRSIKYGVPGTAMTPWGDLTNSLQRLQLVIFIRSLSEEKEKREKLTEALYHTFETAQLTVENARIDGSQQIDQLKAELLQLRARQGELKYQITEGKGSPSEIVKIYQQSLEKEKEINELLEQDQQLLMLKEKLKKERELYFYLGVNLITKNLSRSLLQNYFDLIRANSNRYSLQDHQLAIYYDGQIENQIREYRQKMIDDLDDKINELERKKQIIEGKMSSAQQREELVEIQGKIESDKKLKAKLITDTEEAIRLAKQQAEIVNQNESGRQKAEVRSMPEK